MSLLDATGRPLPPRQAPETRGPRCPSCGERENRTPDRAFGKPKIICGSCGYEYPT